ncbi:PTS system sugar-specific permease protein [Microbacterium sp. TS-1]|uniref:Ascorbate-specific PTS system EIIC component n=1 Tax=Microbacterium arborescens TaxID=33883 RepID=A0ABX2WMY5_9MICO|nr:MULTISPECIES: PTS ascorbate transporter subunit IIC [Microbacterium]OAZ45727.1 PTS ascorbate transporter subunit IIC [Microbacterium arborescens]QCR40856.1 PTS ascorbate transporter subunit IIC [Microbacterium sp. SGAir0570]GAD35364.1 PTS system sugar-specific permease protein [Microbacterium sp. TS-1]
MDAVIDVLLDIFTQPAVIVALIALIGLAVQGKSFSDVLKGTIRTLVGFLVLAAGAGVVVGSLDPFGAMFQHAFNVQGVVPNNEAIVAQVLLDYGSAAALIFFFGMIVNIVLAATTRFKYIYLSGHVAFYIAAMFAVILGVAGFEPWAVVLWGSIAQGIYMVVSPALVQPFMRRVTGSDDVALGHTGGAGVALSGLVALITRGKGRSKSTEEISFPSGLGFLRDTTVIVALSMAVIYIIVGLFAGAAYIEGELSNGQNFIVFLALQAATFSAGVFIILAGVRVVLAEIVPAFKGISEKLVKNAKPALDVPIVFPFAPNAVLIGFLASFVGGIVGMLGMAALGTAIIIPGVVAHFMTGAASGVIGNAVGGRRGAVLGAFANGVAITFLPLFLLPVLGDIGFSNSTFSDSDYGVFGLILGGVSGAGGQIAVIVALAVALVALYGTTFALRGRDRRKAAEAEADATPAPAATSR